MRSSGLHTVAPPNTGVMEPWNHGVMYRKVGLYHLSPNRFQRMLYDSVRLSMISESVRYRFHFFGAP